MSVAVDTKRLSIDTDGTVRFYDLGSEAWVDISDAVVAAKVGKGGHVELTLIGELADSTSLLPGTYVFPGVDQ